MKRLLSFILIVMFLFTVSCAEEEYSEETYEIIKKMENLNEKDLELIKAQAIVLLMLKSDNTKDSGDLGIWDERYFVDSFKAPTDDKYITTKKPLDGTFSNSAATDAQLSVNLIISEKNGKPFVGIELYEYGSIKVKNGNYKEQTYYAQFKDENEEGYIFTCYMPKNGDRIYFKDMEVGIMSSGSSAEFVEALKNNKRLKIKVSDYGNSYTSTYLFAIEETTGLETALNWLLGENE